MPAQPTYWSQVLDHLGLVAGLFDELGIGDVIDHATQQAPEKRDLTAGEAVKAMVLNGLGCIHQALSLVPRFFQQKPTNRRISPRVPPEHLHDEALGRALEPLDESGVTARYRLIAVTAATRLDLSPPYRHLDTTSLHVDGRDHSDEPPAAPVVSITKGYSREHRPDLNHVMWALIVAPQAGMPVLLQPLRGTSSEPHEVGQVIQAHVKPWQPTDGATDLVAASALSSEANRDTLAQTALKWITRVPAPVRDAPVALAQADPSVMAPRQEGARDHELTSSDGGVEHRWRLSDAEARPPQARRTAATPLRHQTDKAVQAFKTFCRTTVACDADARQALSTCAQDWQGTFLATSTVPATPRDDKRGRPGQGVPPEQVVDQSDGALASSLTPRRALSAQPRCVLLATNELDATPLPPPALLEGDNGPVQAERGVRFMTDPSFLASSRYRKKPARSMARLMGMTVWLFVSAALAYRRRQALKDHAATFPDQNGKRIQHPTARGVVHDFVGRHWLCQAGHWPMVRNLTAEPQHVRRLLGQPYMRFYDVRYA